MIKTIIELIVTKWKYSQLAKANNSNNYIKNGWNMVFILFELIFFLDEKDYQLSYYFNKFFF